MKQPVLFAISVAFFLFLGIFMPLGEASPRPNEGFPGRFNGGGYYANVSLDN